MFQGCGSQIKVAGPNGEALPPPARCYIRKAPQNIACQPVSKESPLVKTGDPRSFRSRRCLLCSDLVLCRRVPSRLSFLTMQRPRPWNYTSDIAQGALTHHCTLPSSHLAREMGGLLTSRCRRKGILLLSANTFSVYRLHNSAIVQCRLRLSSLMQTTAPDLVILSYLEYTVLN